MPDPIHARTGSAVTKTPGRVRDGAKEIVDIPSRPVSQPHFDRVHAPPSFTLDEVRRSIPADCFQRDAVKSVYYFIRDFAFVAAAAAAFHYAYVHPYFNNSADSTARVIFWGVVFPIYLFVQSTTFWAIFVVGHDCGHGSFSGSETLNNFVGHICHTFILVPYHSWRISHHHHHMNTGSVENDHSFVAPPRAEYSQWTANHKIVRFTTFWFLGWPVYLLSGMHPVFESHFNPNSPTLFTNAADKAAVKETLVWYTAMLALIGGGIYSFGFLPVFLYYLLPVAGFAAWVSIVTHLHHTHPDIPWFRGESWYYLRGALSSVDRSYGPLIDHWHHDIGTHVVHHIFHKIPHYNLKRATVAAKKILGDYHRVDRSGIFVSLFRNWKFCRCVDDSADAMYYHPQ